MPFDPSAARRRIDRLWSLRSQFGMERGGNHSYLDEIVSDRYALVSGLQILRDELQFADLRPGSDVGACGADLSVPSVVTTVAYTNCGDRIHQGEGASYRRTVAARFATVSETGDVKMESFSPTGGGTDDGATLAHVTVAHQLDNNLRKRIYDGHPQSFVAVFIDLKTHVGRLDEGTVTSFGRTRESAWRQPRAACGAIVGTLAHFDSENAVHRRLRADLGEANFERLSKDRIVTNDAIDITAVVAASIVAVQGMLNTAAALVRELDERGVAHLTASVTVNRAGMSDPVIYLARATVFGGQIRMQGFGTRAAEYAGRMIRHADDTRLTMSYGGVEGGGFPVRTLDAPARPAH